MFQRIKPMWWKVFVALIALGASVAMADPGSLIGPVGG